MTSAARLSVVPNPIDLEIDERERPASNLARLEALTETLAGPERVKPQVGSSYVEYPVRGGECFGFGLFRSRDGAVAVQRARLDAGVEFPLHVHDETETLTVYKGRAVVWIDGDDIELGIGDSITIRPGQTHEVHAIETTWLVGVTIPASGGYPDGAA